MAGPVRLRLAGIERVCESRRRSSIDMMILVTSSKKFMK